jgi:adenylate kinase
MKLWILIGPPGCGKGTQSSYITSHLGYKSVSTGELLRNEVRNKSTIGLKCEEYMTRGGFPPVEYVYEVMDRFFNCVDSDKILLDGFPRTITQAEYLEGVLSKHDWKVSGVLNFSIDENVLHERLCGRFACSVCGIFYNKYSKPPKTEGRCDSCGSESFSVRKDDNEESIKERLKLYYQETAPLIEFYRDLVFNVNGMHNPDIVFENIKSKLNLL